ncbi:2-keto-3-deoxygluconate permease [Microvirga aerilata]|uniref:2-keto-3-deoxygluconate permease n=1 Tax=Microvirga aerilata TaxID=670292 RepID=A0A936ZJ47_9HYPH|nr:2-keto-3-deoxygluconate permease [Microvirga aerilata]
MARANCATFATFALRAGDYFDSFTGALFKGSLSIPMMFWICMDPTIDICSTPYVLQKGAAILVTKVGMGIQISVIVIAIPVPLVTHRWATRVQSTAVSPGAMPEPQAWEVSVTSVGRRRPRSNQQVERSA